ncbi:hypothetical protein FAF44_20700 [Nonomuraea sp. MG754425]|uniref:hypothetical protein n=1 Tax=Nonomuraea sp. MG754425 TaxID=2570319 RepID=UPI001F3701F0|nr:hypothetical protein [Nonomuraea sp. MG754425]MCF6470793.1 hypothetical protein [Nonomuraea sp. MG754425]
MRLLVPSATAAALALGALAAPFGGPADAATAVYGFAWADGQGHLRIVPKSATRATRQSFTLKARAKAKELRLGYAGAAYRRVTTACDLKETEGRVAVDANGLGRTTCEPADLTDTLARGPVPVRAEYRHGEATRINEILVGDWGSPRTARGTIKRVNDTTVLFQSGSTKIKLGYTYTTAFYRTTAGCGDGWLAGRPVNADRNGLGRKQCGWTDLTKALKAARHPVLVKVDLTPGVGALNEVWEVYGDA